MKAPEKLTDSLVKRLSPPEAGNRVTYDGEVKGFGLRVTAAGAKAFVLNYRASGRERRYTIGSYPDWTVAAARDEAKRLKKLIDVGYDPMAEREADRAAPTMADLARRYVEEHLPRKRPKSQVDDRRMIKQTILPRIGRHKVADVGFADVDAIHRDLTRKGTRTGANRVVALLSKMFALAIKWGWRTDNPARGIERNQEEKRTRYLAPDELGRLASTLNQAPNRQSANAVRMMLLTGARRGEILGARWDQFDLQAGVWTKPSSHTKQKKEHRVPLSAPALALLADMRAKATGPHLFPGRTPEEHQTEIKRFWASVCRRAGIEGCRIHDLRHSYASILASAGLSLPIIGQLLGHTQAATTARYAHLYDDPLRQATERVGALFKAASSGKSADVVPFRSDHS